MKKTSYFYLYPYVFLEIGKNSTALYDTIKQKVYEIPLEIGEKYIEGERSIHMLLKSIDSYEKGKIIEMLELIVKLEMGFFSESRMAVDFIIADKNYLKLFKNYPYVNRLIIQLSEKCLLECNSCKTQCTGCFKTDVYNELSLDRVIKIIENLKTIWKIDEIILTGGNIWEYSYLINLLNWLRKNKFHKITHLYFLMDINKENYYLKKLSSLSYALDGFVLSPLVLSVSHLKNVIKIINKTKEKIKQQFLLRVNKDINNRKLIRSLDKEKFSYIKCYINQISLNFNCDLLIEGKDLESYLFSKHFNDCLFGSIIINSKGNVTPCLYSGVEFNFNVNEVLKGGYLLPFWENFKRNIEPCKSCAFVTACIQCRIKDYVKKHKEELNA